MSTTRYTSTTSDPSTSRLGSPQLVGIGISVILGIAVWALGLPSSVSVFGTELSTLTVPAALLVAFAGITLISAAVATRWSWSVTEIVVAATLGVAGGFFFWGVASIWTPLTKPLDFYPPLSAVLAGLWLVPGVLGGLVVRRPGAAVYTELVAAILEALLGNQWGFSTVWYGFLEGLGAEVVLAVLLYRAWGLTGAMLAGAGAGVTVGLMDSFVYYPAFSSGYKAAYVGLAVVSGAVIAGVGAWALTRALATAGALGPLASGRAAERV